MNTNLKLVRLFMLTILMGTVFPALSFADEVGRQNFTERIPIPSEPSREAAKMEDSKWLVDTSLGLNVLFFEEEDTIAAPGVFVDIGHTDVPLNFRIGIEGNDIDAEQDNALAVVPGATHAELNFIRIPVTLEYVVPLMESTKLFLGGGADLIHIDHDVDDTTVGGHLGARIRQQVIDRLSVSVEGGYLWAEPKSDAGDLDMDSAYVSSMVSLALN